MTLILVLVFIVLLIRCLSITSPKWAYSRNFAIKQMKKKLHFFFILSLYIFLYFFFIHFEVKSEGLHKYYFYICFFVIKLYVSYLEMVLDQACAHFFPVENPSENIHTLHKYIDLSKKDILHAVIFTSWRHCGDNLKHTYFQYDSNI